MAKKKQSNNIGQILTLSAILLGIIAFVMVFLPAVAIKDSETAYNGLQVAFGYSEENILGGTTTYLQFSFMNLLTVILVLVGVVFTVLGMLGKGSKFANLISGVSFIVAGVFFFLSVAFCIPEEGFSNIIGFFGGNIKDWLVLGVGAIIGGILSILAGAACLGNVVLKK